MTKLPNELIDLIASFIPAQKDIKRLPKIYKNIKDKQCYIRKCFNRHRYLQEDLLMKHRLFIMGMTKGEYKIGLYEYGHIEFPLKLLRMTGCPYTFYTYELHILFGRDAGVVLVNGMRGDGACCEWLLIEMDYKKELNYYNKAIKRDDMESIETVW